MAGVDVARGVALLGMFAVHVLPGQDADGSASTAYLIANGRAAATFAVLAGVGLALAYRPRGDRRTRWAIAAALATRALLIGAVGLLLGALESGLAIILSYYAALFLLAIPLLRCSTGALAGLAAAAVIVVPVVSHLLRQRLPEMSGANPTLPRLLEEPVPLLTEITLTGYYPALAWTAYLCAGLAVGRLDLRSRRVAGGLLLGGVGLAAAAVVASRLLLGPGGGGRELVAASPSLDGRLEQALEQSQFGTTPTTTWWWLATASPHASTPLDLLHTVGTAIALLGVALLVGPWARRALRPLAAAGAMTLTLYSTHVLLLAAGVLPSDDEVSYALQVAAALAVATGWLRRHSRGPLEAGIARASAAAARALSRPR